MTMPNFLIIGTAILATHSNGVLLVIDAPKNAQGLCAAEREKPAGRWGRSA